MSLPRFLQIHTLHSYPAALLNRDDAGLAKRLPYGDKVRLRISSQCLKRHWRTADDAFSLDKLNVPMSIRSREIPRHIKDRVIAAGVSEPLAQAAIEGLRAGGLTGKSANVDGDEASSTKQVVLLGVSEIDYLVKRCVALAARYDNESDLKSAVATSLQSERKNIESMKLGSGLEAALFGRMATSDVLASRDAAVYVSHSFTVHEAQAENDYLSAVDDLLQSEGQAGAGGIFDVELTSGLYYGYVVVDVPQLVANLEGIPINGWSKAPQRDRELSGDVVKSLIHLIAKVSPGAKRGSTAPFGWASMVLVEAGDWQPRSLAGAFETALPIYRGDLRKTAATRLSDEIGRLDEAYGCPLARRFLCLDDGISIPSGQRLPLDAIADWARSAVVQAHAEA